jgi:4-hydroxy-3-polyprenylbenzoate decarboxylase
MSNPRRIIVAISGASGAIYGVRLLQALRAVPGIETHLVVSDAGWRNLALELGLQRTAIEALADQSHDIRNVGASIASGSFRCSGMVVAPCSMRTLAAVAHGLSDNLLTRAADVTLKERRDLLLMVRESPLHLVHLRNMVTVTEMGAIVCPPLPAGRSGGRECRPGAGPSGCAPCAGDTLAGSGIGGVKDGPPRPA